MSLGFMCRARLGFGWRMTWRLHPMGLNCSRRKAVRWWSRLEWREILEEESRMTKIDHLGIDVNSIQQARPLYEALGLAVLEDEDEEEGVRSVMIPVGESRLRLLESSTQQTR